MKEVWLVRWGEFDELWSEYTCNILDHEPSRLWLGECGVFKKGYRFDPKDFQIKGDVLTEEEWEALLDKDIMGFGREAPCDNCIHYEYLMSKHLCTLNDVCSAPYFSGFEYKED